MKKFNLYKTWLIVSVVTILLAVVLTIILEFSIPKDCSACGMAALGLVPFWLLAFGALIVNAIAIPVTLKKRSHELTRKLRTVSWTLLAVSALALIAIVFLMLQDS